MSSGWIGPAARSLRGGGCATPPVTPVEFTGRFSLKPKRAEDMVLPLGARPVPGKPWLYVDPMGVVRRVDEVESIAPTIAPGSLLPPEQRAACLGRFNQRQGVEDRVAHDSDDEEYDVFGRKKKKRKKADVAPKNPPEEKGEADRQQNVDAGGEAEACHAGSAVAPAPCVGSIAPAAAEQNAGDWVCPTCTDLQFRRNVVCRRCGTPNPSLTAGASVGGPCGDGIDQVLDVDTFLGRNRVAPRAAQQLRSMSRTQQRCVIMRGSLMDARDPTAVLIARMQQVMAKHLRGDL